MVPDDVNTLIEEVSNRINNSEPLRAEADYLDLHHQLDALHEMLINNDEASPSAMPPGGTPGAELQSDKLVSALRALPREECLASIERLWERLDPTESNLLDEWEADARAAHDPTGGWWEHRLDATDAYPIMDTMRNDPRFGVIAGALMAERDDRLGPQVDSGAHRIGAGEAVARDLVRYWEVAEMDAHPDPVAVIHHHAAARTLGHELRCAAATPARPAPAVATSAGPTPPERPYLQP